MSVAYREVRRSVNADGLLPAIRHSKDPTNLTVLTEDAAAVLGVMVAFAGVFLGRILHKPYLDGVASICIGVLLTAAAAILANETRSLLIGEGVHGTTLKRICELVQRDPAVERARRPLSMYFGPDEVLLALEIQFRPTLSAREVAEAIDRVEKAIREQYPEIRHIYIEAEAITATTRGRQAA